MDCIWKNMLLQFYWESASVTGDLDRIQTFLKGGFQNLKQSGFEAQAVES